MKIKARSLMEAAEASGQNESYLVIHSSSECKLGVSAVRQSDGTYDFFMELVMILCTPGRNVDMERLDRAVKTLGFIRGVGYDVVCEGGTVTCEKRIPEHSLNEEAAQVLGAI